MSEISPSASAGSRRWPAIAIIAALLAALVGAGRSAVDESTESTTPTTAALGRNSAGVLMPTAFASESLSSTWFCAGGTASEDGFADHSVVVANPTATPRTATITVYPGALSGDPNAEALAASRPPPVSVAVGAYSRATIRLGDVIDAPYAAALVEVPGGDVVVEHQVEGDGGLAAAPCATTASPTWYFASGTVSQSTGEVLAIFNPFPDTAVVDLDFATTDGRRSPPEFQNLPVPPGQLVAVDVFAAIARHDQISVSAVTESGRVVIDRLQSHGGSVRGLSVALGATEPALTWYFPDGQTGEGLVETYTVYNPGEREAQVDLEVQLGDPTVQVEPIPVTVLPGGYAQVVVNNEQRIPAGAAHTVIVRSVNGVPVVPERRISADDPATRSGVSDTLGSPLIATQWAFGAGTTTEETAEFLVLYNPSSETISRVTVASLAGGQTIELAGLENIELPPVGRFTIDLGAIVNREELFILVTATQPIVVERSLYAAEGAGLSLTVGVPLAAGVRGPLN